MFECLIRRFSTQPRPIADCRPAEVQSERIAKAGRNGGEATTIGIGRHICVVCDKNMHIINLALTASLKHAAPSSNPAKGLGRNFQRFF